MTLPTRINLGYEPRPWQQRCHDERTRFTVLAVHRRAGKTRLALMELIDHALRATVDLPLYVYVAPFLKQASAIAWGELKRILEPLRVAGALDVRELDLQVTFKHNGAKIRLFGADNPDALRGLRLDGAVIDEPAGVKPDAWFEVIRPALSDRQGWTLFIGTPHGVDLFSELFYKAPTLKDWSALRFTVEETNALPEEEVEEMRGSMGPMAFAREFLCDFTASGDDQLISLADVETAAKRVYVEGDIGRAPRVLGVDPARFGDDRSVIVKRQGLQMFDAIVMQEVDNMQLAARVAGEIDVWKPDAVFIDSGAGAGVIDRLRQLRYSVVEVPFGGKASKPLDFKDRRTEMWWTMREWLIAGGAIPDDVALKTELAAPIYWYDPQGRKVLEPKADIKKRLPGAGSPDIADALALTFAAPVAPRPLAEVLGIGGHVRAQRREYDPFEGI